MSRRIPRLLLTAVLALCSASAQAQFARIQEIPGQVDRNAAWAPGITVQAANGDVLAFLLEYGEWTNFNTFPPQGTPAHLKLARTTDGGATWSSPLELREGHATNGTQGIGVPQVVVEPSGRIVLTFWYVFSPAPAYSAGVEIWASDDHGATWTKTGNKPKDTVSLALSSEGHLVSVDWRDDPVTFESELWTTTSADGGATWGSDAKIPGVNPLCGGAHLSVDGDAGDWVIVYQACGTPSTLAVVRSADKGATWSAPMTVGTTTARFGASPTIAQLADGTMWLTYLDGPVIVTRTSTDGGASWSGSTAWTGGTDATRDLNPRCASSTFGPICSFGSRRAGANLKPFVGIAGSSLDPLIAGTTTESAETPAAFALSQNYPNPFNPSTRIRFDLRNSERVSLTLHDALGRLVQVLDAGMRPAGSHEVHLEAAGLPSGVYVYRLQAGAASVSRTMTLLR